MLPDETSETAQAREAREVWMRAALDEAQRAAEHGDVPVGCVIVGPDGTLLGRGENRRELDGDPTAHAEIIALREAARARGHWRLDGCTTFVTLEPCPMCAGALVNARVSHVVFGATDPKAGAVLTLFDVGLTPKLNHRFEVVSGVLADEAAQQLRAFFAKLRAAGEK
jgi:tRNA(adenine34) deaminase